MAEYIDRENYCENICQCNCNNEYCYRVSCPIWKAPAADVAPVVRCKDCKYHHDCGTHFCDRLGMDFPDDSEFFCKYGTRMDGDDDAKAD